MKPVFVRAKSILPALFVAALTAGCTAQGSDNGLVVGQLEAVENRINFVMSNTTQKSNDVVAWVEQGGVRMCEIIFHIPAGARVTMGQNCRSLDYGDFNHLYAWAADRPDITAIARRIQ